MNPISDRIQVMLRAIVAGMHIVHIGQRGAVGEVEVKQGDAHNTVVTRWDKESESAILEVLAGLPYDIYSEERGFVSNKMGDEELLLLVDPLDGPLPFAVGIATSTVSIGLYSPGRRTVVAVVVGEPATGRVWWAEEGTGAWLGYARQTQVVPGTIRRLSVWQGELGAGAVTLVDCYHGFRLAGYPQVSNAIWGKFWAALNERGVVYGCGTNCGHLAYVAQGRGEDKKRGIAGAITTCRGGPHDIAAGLLVREAGGFTRAFSNRTGTLVEVLPLDVVQANFLLAAVSEEVLQEYTSIFMECLG